MKKIVIIVLMLFAVGCEKKSTTNSEHDRVTTLNEELVREIVSLIENDKAMNRQAEATRIVYRDVYMDVRDRLDKLEKEVTYDPNAQQYRYLEAAEPNWVATFGDTLETRMLYNISKNRVKIAMIDKILSADSNLIPYVSPVDPNETK